MDGLDQLANRTEAEQEKGYGNAAVCAPSEDVDRIAMVMTQANIPEMPNALPIITPIADPTRDRVTQHAQPRTGRGLGPVVRMHGFPFRARRAGLPQRRPWPASFPQHLREGGTSSRSRRRS